MKNANCWSHILGTWLFLICILNKEFTTAEEQIVTINTAKWAQVVSDRFLSITVDPETLLLGKDIISGTTRTINLARGLAPLYLRVGGPNINQYRFESMFSGDVLDNKTITESQWVMLNDFAREAGMDIIVCLSALQRLNGVWDPRNALDLISFSDKMGYKINWELGYELQKVDEEISAEQLAIDVNRLRNILNSFSQYKHSIIVGPDITQLYTKKDIDFLRDFIQEAGSSLDAITWHPKYLSTSSQIMSGEELDYMLERLIYEKEGLTKTLGRQIARKPIWIAESDKNTSQVYFLDALNWAQELGTFAGIGIQTVMKQPNLQELLEATPIYWVSLLHKALAGHVVLDVRHSSVNNTNVPVFCHCTSMVKSSKAAELVITDNKYEPGAITFFAVNRGSSEVRLSVKLNSGIKQEDMELHQYLLSADQTEGNPLFSRNVLLNGKLLALGPTGGLPELSPNIQHIGWNITVSLPPASIGFWVIPRANVKFCVTASKRPTSHKTDMLPQPLVKAGSSLGSYNTRNTEVLSRDLKHNDVVGVLKHEMNLDDSETRMFKKKKHHSLKNKKLLERKTQESKDFGTVYKHETRTLDVSKNKKEVIEADSSQLNKDIVKEHELESQGNSTGNISTEQKLPVARFKRYAPESNAPITFSGVPLDAFQQPSLGGRAAKTRRKKKAELKSDKKEDKEQRKDKLKQKDDELQATLFDPFLASIENEEQYFHHNMKREENEIRPFPTGDVYLKQGDSSEERRDSDYDYIDRDEKEINEDEDGDEMDDIETADVDISLKPGEFFETIHGTRDKINEQFVGYGGELWEAETFTMAPEKIDAADDDDDAYDQEVVRESGPTEEEDRKRKAAAARLLNSYLTEGYADKQSEENKHKDKPSKKTRIQRKTERKQEYAQDYDDENNYFLTDHKEKTKKNHDKPNHHHFHHHHIAGHSRSAKDSKHNHYDHVHNMHNHKDKARKITNHDEKHILSEEDDIFFPHISHEVERDHKRNHAYHRNLRSSEEILEPLKASHKGREKAAKNSDTHHIKSEYLEGSSTSTKSSRQSRARKVSAKIEEEANAKLKHDLKTSENIDDDNLSGMYPESAENKKVSHQTDKQQKKKNNKAATLTGSNDHAYQEKEIHEEKKKSKDKQKYESQHSHKYEAKSKKSEELDSRSVENLAKTSKKKVQVMETNGSFEDEGSKINSGETTEDVSEETEVEPDTVEDIDEKTISVNPSKSSHKAAVKSSPEHLENSKVKSPKQRSEKIKTDPSAVSSKNNERGGYRKSKRYENSTEDHTSGHRSGKAGSSRKSSELNEYSSEEIKEKTKSASKSSTNAQNSRHKSESGSKNKHKPQENSLEQENDNNQSIEQDSLENSKILETKSDDANENLSVASHSEPEPKQEPLSDEDLSNEDVSSQHDHIKTQQKSLNASKSKRKTSTKHRSEESTLEDNISGIQGELKKRHTSTEHYTEANEELELRSEISKQEEEDKNSGEAEKPRVPSDENNDKPSKEKEKKQKSGKQRVAKKKDHHNRARRETFPMSVDGIGNNSNYNYSSEDSNKTISISEESELSPDVYIGYKDNEMQYLMNSANELIGNIVAEGNDVNLESIMLLAPQQYVENEKYLAGDASGMQIKLEDEAINNFENEMENTWTFRNDASLETALDQGEETLIKQNNAKREVDTKTFENDVKQSNKIKQEDNKENLLYKSSPIQENLSYSHDKETATIRDDEKSNRHVQFPIDAGRTDVRERTSMQDNHFSDSSANVKDLSNENKNVHLSESVNPNTSIETSGEVKTARNVLILEENELQNTPEKSANEDLSREQLLDSKERSTNMPQSSLELKSEINEYIGEDVAMKSLAAPEDVGNLPVYFGSSSSDDKKHAEPIFAEESKQAAFSGDDTHDEHDNTNNTESNASSELKYPASIPEDVQPERVPKAIMFVVENTSNIDEIEAKNVERSYILNEAEETRNSDTDVEKPSTVENTEKYSILESSSKEIMRNVELLDGTGTTLYDQERSARDTNTGAPESLSSISPATNIDDDTPTKVSLVNANQDARNSASNNTTSANVSKESTPNERSASAGDAKRIKGLKPLPLPKKNIDRGTLEQKYKERIKQLKERRAKIKAGLFKKPDSVQIKKADTINTNKKLRKQRSIGEENQSSLKHLVNDENLSDTDSVDSSSDSQSTKSLSKPASKWDREDYGTLESVEEQLYNIKSIQNAQHRTPHLWDTDTFVTPSYVVTESMDTPDHYTSESIDQRSIELSDSISVPVTLHKTLLITENNPYSNEEAVVGKTEKAINEYSSEEVFMKLTAPLINYEPFNHLQQGVTHFQKLVPVHENDIDTLSSFYPDNYDSENAEPAEELDLSRYERYAPSDLEGDTNFKSNFYPWSFSETSNVNEYPNDNVIILKTSLHRNEENNVYTLPAEPNAPLDNLQDVLGAYDWFSEGTSSIKERDSRKEAILESDVLDSDTGILLPVYESITDTEAAKPEEETSAEDGKVFAVRSRRALKLDYDPSNDDLLLPFNIPIMPEDEKSRNAFLGKIDAELKEINNKIDSLEGINSESDIKMEITNEHKLKDINQMVHIPQIRFVSPLTSINKVSESNSINQISNNAESINAVLVKENLINRIHPNSLDFHIFDFDQKQDDYDNKENGVNVIIFDQVLNEAEDKPFYKDKGLRTKSVDGIKYLFPNLGSYNPVKKIIKEYEHVKDLGPNVISMSAESSAVIIDNNASENNNTSDDEASSEEILSKNTNANHLNHSLPTHFADSDAVSSHSSFNNTSNSLLNNTNDSELQGMHVNYHAEGIPDVKQEDDVTAKSAHNKSARATTKGKRENTKGAAESHPITLHSILKLLTRSVIGFLHQLSPWNTSAN